MTKADSVITMGKKKTSAKFKKGDRVQVKEGINLPEFSEYSCSGWTGTIVDLLGKKSDPKVVIEWDDAIIDSMPEDYVKLCEEKQLFYRMACLTGPEIETLSESA